METHDQNRFHDESQRGGPGEGAMTAIACLIIIVVFTIIALCF